MKRIIISGTYSTGKTVTSLCLNLLSGIETTHAKTMRELLPIYLPGKKLEDCGISDFIELIVRRMSERVKTEKSTKNSFISDGCPLQEWAYCLARMKFGFNPNESQTTMLKNKILFPEKWVVFDNSIKAFEIVAKEYVKNNYDLIIHLPVEFPFVEDGHRPINEKFRIESEGILLEAYKEIDIPVIVVNGSLEKRLNDIMDYLNLPYNMTITKAINESYDIKKTVFDSITII